MPSIKRSEKWKNNQSLTILNESDQRQSSPLQRHNFIPLQSPQADRRYQHQDQKREAIKWPAEIQQRVISFKNHQATTERLGEKLKLTEDYLRSGDLEIVPSSGTAAGPNISTDRDAYDMNAIGIIGLSKRDDGALIIIDGHTVPKPPSRPKVRMTSALSHLCGAHPGARGRYFLQLDDGAKARVINRFPIGSRSRTPLQSNQGHPEPVPLDHESTAPATAMWTRSPPSSASTTCPSRWKRNRTWSRPSSSW